MLRTHAAVTRFGGVPEIFRMVKMIWTLNKSTELAVTVLVRMIEKGLK
jgi:hypothetical protein